jgi:hypothetical protein
MRASRLGTSFTFEIIEKFEKVASAVGKVFKIADHSVRVFSESFIRSHLMFQLCKATEL